MNVFYAPEGFPGRCQLSQWAMDDSGKRVPLRPRVALIRGEGDPGTFREVGSLLGPVANFGSRVPPGSFGLTDEQPGRWVLVAMNCPR